MNKKEKHMKKRILFMGLLLSTLVLSSCGGSSGGDGGGNTPEPTPEPEPQVVEVTDFTLDNVTGVINLAPGGTFEVTYTISPEDATDKTVSWRSSDTTVATVAAGVITAVGNGEAVITASVSNFTNTINIKVTSDPTDIELDHQSLEIRKGDTATLNATVTPAGSTYSGITWRSSNEGIATVEDGVVTALNRGFTTITASIEEFGLSTSCEVEVSEFFSITRGEDSFEAITLNYPKEGKYGDKIVVEVSEAVADTYDFDYLTITYNGRNLNTNQGEFYFYMPNENVTLLVTRAPELQIYNINLADASYEELFNIEGESFTAKKNHQVSFNITPKEEGTLEIVDVYLQGKWFESNYDKETGDFTFKMPESNVTIVIESRKPCFNVSFKDDYGMTGEYRNAGFTGLTDDGKGEYGSTIWVTFSNAFYLGNTIEGIKINDGELIPYNKNNPYELPFTMPAEDVVVEIIFERNYYNIVLPTTEHAQINVFHYEGEQLALLINHTTFTGETLYFQIIEEEDYAVTQCTIFFDQDNGWGKSSCDLLADYYFDPVVGMARFDVPGIKKDTEITFNYREVYAPYKNADFLGEYFGVYINGENKGTTGFNNSYQMAINQTGNINVYGYSRAKVTGYEGERINIQNTAGDKNSYMIRHGNLLICGDIASKFGDYTSTSMYIEVKKENENDYANKYQIYVTRILKDEYTIIEVFKKDSSGNIDYDDIYASALYIKAEDKFYFDVEFVFPDQVHYSGLHHIGYYSATFDVVYEGEVLISVYTNSVYYAADIATICEARGVLDGLQGTYVGYFDGDETEYTLVLDGKGNGIFNGVTDPDKYTIDEEGRLVFLHKDRDNNLWTYKTITLGEGTFTGVIEEVPIHHFVGRNYFFGDNNSNYSYIVTITFEAPGVASGSSYHKKSHVLTYFDCTLEELEDENCFKLTIVEGFHGFTGILTVEYHEEEDYFYIKSGSGSWYDWGASSGRIFA